MNNRLHVFTNARKEADNIGWHQHKVEEND
jgi:hypothetical protein